MEFEAIKQGLLFDVRALLTIATGKCFCRDAEPDVWLDYDVKSDNYKIKEIIIKLRFNDNVNTKEYYTTLFNWDTSKLFSMSVFKNDRQLYLDARKKYEKCNGLYLKYIETKKDIKYIPLGVDLQLFNLAVHDGSTPYMDPLPLCMFTHCAPLKLINSDTDYSDLVFTLTYKPDKRLSYDELMHFGIVTAHNRDGTIEYKRANIVTRNGCACVTHEY